MKSRIALALCFVLAASAHLAIAAEVVEILPVTRDILLLHLDDGEVRKHQLGEERTHEWVVEPYTPVDTAVADSAAAFAISSPDDPNYLAASVPGRVWRKTKGTEWTWLCQQYTSNGCVNTDHDHTSEHWIYLELPHPMVSGRTYSVSWTPQLGLTETDTELVFEEINARSEVVHVNQLGYRSDSPAKYGYLYHWMGSGGGLDLDDWEGEPFRLVNAETGQTAFTGTIAFRKAADNPETGQIDNTPNQNFLGAAVWECDFTAFNQPGDYRLVVDGIGASFPFSIARDPYREPFYWAMKGLYHNRSGIELKAPYTDHPRKAPHHPRLTPGFAGRLKYSTFRFIDMANQDSGTNADKLAIEAGYQGNLMDSWGWYQDAGDWDGYVSHFEVPSGLLFLWASRPSNFTDGELNIPESGNGLPDVLDEAAWLPRFFHRLRHELIDNGWGSGGVGSRVFGDQWGNDEAPSGTGRGSWLDTTRDWYVTGEDPFSSYRYAAVAAQLASALDSLGFEDPEGVDWKEEARETYAWALANTRPGDEAISQLGAALRYHRAYAAAALYRLTGDSDYGAQAAADLSLIRGTDLIEQTRLWATVAYLELVGTRPVDTGLVTTLRQALAFTATEYTSGSADRRACRFGGNWFLPMLIGQGTTPLILPALLGESVLETTQPALSAAIRATAFTTADYFLGNNPLNMVWISGVGERHPVGIFHLDAWYSGAPETFQGVIPYGPWYDGGQAADGPWSHTWAYPTLYPDISQWPGHEQWFEMSTAPLQGEFTVHQNTMPAAVTYGFLTVTPTPPSITTPPKDQSAEAGERIELSIEAQGSGTITYQWYQDGVPLPGATEPVLNLPAAQLYHSGNYTVTVTGPGGETTSPGAVVEVTPPDAYPATLLNISTRGFCLTGAEILIPGFVVTGENTARLLARVIGPTLGDFGVPSVLPDPHLELKLADSVIAVNDNWGANPEADIIAATAIRLGAFILPSDSLDSAVLEDLVSNTYSIHARDLADATGNAIVEVYLDPENSDASLSNISTRGSVQTGAGILIGGLAVGSPGKGRFLIRGVGPALKAFGVTSALDDPRLKVFSGRDLIESNDDWNEGPESAGLPAAFAAVGAFAFTDGSKDAALMLTLAPGTYTIQLEGVDDATGTALVEIYRLE